MELTRTLFTVVCSMLMITACSDSHSDDWGYDAYTNTVSGNTRSASLGTDNIPVNLKDLSKLPEWIQTRLKGKAEKDLVMAHFKIFQGKFKGETIYFFDDLLSSCIDCNYYHHDGRQIEAEEWENQNNVTFLNASDWTCIYSALPFVKGITGIFHYDPNEETRNHYVENNLTRYYVWGYLNTSELKKYDGKQVLLSGFSAGNINEAINDIADFPAGTTCYGIEATYINIK